MRWMQSHSFESLPKKQRCENGHDMKLYVKNYKDREVCNIKSRKKELALENISVVRECLS